MLHQGLRLFSATAKDKRVAAFQAQHAFALPRQLHQPQRDIALLGRGLSATFARIFVDCLRSPIKDPLLHKRVIDHDIGLPQRVERMQRQQPRIAWARAAQPDPARFETGPILAGQ